MGDVRSPRRAEVGERVTSDLAVGAAPHLSAPPAVLIVHGHPLVRYGLVRLLDDHGIPTSVEADTVTSGHEHLRALRPDVLLVDVDLADGSGLDLVRAARHQDRRTGVVALARTDDASSRAALEAGATHLLHPASSPREVVATVHRAAGRQVPVAVRAGLPAAAARAAVVPSLTGREREVLERLAVGDSVAGMARQLYMSESTVKTHIAKVYAKLGAHNRASAVMAAVRLGIVES